MLLLSIVSQSIFGKLDVDHDGDITEDEFIQVFHLLFWNSKFEAQGPWDASLTLYYGEVAMGGMALGIVNFQDHLSKNDTFTF